MEFGAAASQQSMLRQPEECSKAVLLDTLANQQKKEGHVVWLLYLPWLWCYCVAKVGPWLSELVNESRKRDENVSPIIVGRANLAGLAG